LSTTSEELKKLYKKLGGDEENIRKASTPAEILNGINELDLNVSGGIEDLNDVDISDPETGDVIKYNGEKWVNDQDSITKTASGNPIEISDSASAPLVKCVTEIQGSQDLHGYDKPWVGGAGKNKLPNSATGSQTVEGLTITSDGNGNYVVNGTRSTTYLIVFDLSDIVVPTSNQKLYFAGTYNGTISFMSENGSRIDYWTMNGRNRLITDLGNLINARVAKIRFEAAQTTHSNETFCCMLIDNSVTDYSFEPYSNICPITAYTEGEIEVSDGDGNTTTHTTTFSQTIYQGNADFVGGEVECDMPVIDLGDLTWGVSGVIFYASITGLKRPATTGNVLNAICDSYEIVSQATAPSRTEACISGLNWIDGIAIWNSNYTTGAEVKTAMAGIKMAFELATPTTEPITPTNLPVKSLNGYTHIESSTGEMEIEYITGKYQPIIDVMKQLVKANPSGEPTDTLSSIEVDGVTYSVPQGGGGSIQRMLMNNTITIE